MNKCTRQLSIDMNLYSGSQFIKFKRLLESLHVYSIYPNRHIHEQLIDIIDTEYIQPLYAIYADYIEERTHHKINFHGDGSVNYIEYKDTGALFRFMINDSCVDVYYNDNATNDDACDLIHVLETIYFFNPNLDLGEMSYTLHKESEEWIKGIRERVSSWDNDIEIEYSNDDYDDDEEEALWQEYLSELKEDFIDWKERRAKRQSHVEGSTGPDYKAGTLMYYNGDEWKEIDGIENATLTVGTDGNNFYADDTLFYTSEPTYEFSFNCVEVSDALREVVEQLKKSQTNSAPP